jgi:hypothetical protein
VAKRDISEHKLDEFAADLGRLLGTAQSKAEGWLSQRTAIVKQLTAVRDTAVKLLKELGQHAGAPAKGREAGHAGSGKPRRRLSAKARKAISDAQKRRWAARKASAG